MPLIDYSFLNKILPKAKIKKSFKKAKSSYLIRVRLATALFFFGMGFCFATWASRIPDLKLTLNLSESDLGTILFALPIGQLLAMPLSGKVVSKYGSRKIAILGLLSYAFFLTVLGLPTQSWQLGLGLFLFGFFGNFCNIAVNTLGVYTQQLFEKPIMGSFHGSWSLAGFSGALLALIMLYFNLSPFQHFVTVLGIITLLVLLNYKYLVKTTLKKVEEKEKVSFFKVRDKSLIWLGVISFCCMASEGIMFDWSGVYFKEIVKAPGSLVVLGYTSFMVTMAIGRFLSDILVGKFGPRKVLIVSGFVISTGLYMAVLFPNLIACTLAFMMVGFGVSNVIPIVFNAAGNSKTVPTSIALTIVSSISFMGFLIGPPVIGYIAEMTSLQYSFAFIGVFGVFISLLTLRLKMFKEL
ncbi:MFS transporter [Flavobacterium aquatile]|uniref:MFS transporter n=1 Tax=Flavobacterium aquatile TaxID=245 RepID=UPI0009DF5EA9|nr:MFS transporter [Flavobacterium aquatile]OXA68648.1 MFS transporter [Flavobacterium aquatile] [Flavobacterium aquatile LMG 4008 = ATCC 11947]GEC79273.1 MFS transporter [Flavobacterium aquatile]